MKITRILAKTVPLVSRMSNAGVSFAELTTSIVAVSAQDGAGHSLLGFGFGSIGRYAQTEMILNRIAPRLLEEPAATYAADEGGIDPLRAWPVLMRNEKPGGHGERSVAVGAIDMALWDLAAKIRGEPLWRLLARRFNHGQADKQVAVYAAGGYYYEGEAEDALRRELSGYLSQGYTAVKIKIGGLSLDRDLRRVRAAIAEVGRADAVAVDANGRYDLAEAITCGRALADLGVRWFEEAGDPLDYELQAALGTNCSLTFATGENLFSHQDVRNLVRYAGLQPERDYLQMDPALSYGVPEYLRMLDVLRDAGWSPRRCLPHGGHRFALHLAAGLQLGGNEAYPGIFQPLSGFGEDMPVRHGTVSMSLAPGIGIEYQPAAFALFKPFLS